jgi:hypothetical protein
MNETELSPASIKKLAQASVLAPYEIISEGSAHWTDATKSAYEEKVKDAPIEKRLAVFLAMKKEGDEDAAHKAKAEHQRTANALWQSVFGQK